MAETKYLFFNMLIERVLKEIVNYQASTIFFQLKERKSCLVIERNNLF